MIEVRKLAADELSAAEDVIESTGAYHRPELADMDGVVWGAFDGPALVGCVWIGVLGKFAILDYLAVDPTKQRSGIAAKILLSAEEELVVSGVKRLQFMCHMGNIPSLALCLKYDPSFSGPFVSGVVELGAS